MSSNANIYLKGSQFGTSADEDGVFIIQDIPAGSYQVQISAIGYVSLNETILLKEGEQTNAQHVSSYGHDLRQV